LGQTSVNFLTSRCSPVKLQFIICKMLKMADESDLLLFTNFLSDSCGKHTFCLPKIDTSKQYYVLKLNLVYLVQ